jgi:hypothetical protein
MLARRTSFSIFQLAVAGAVAAIQLVLHEAEYHSELQVRIGVEICIQRLLDNPAYGAIYFT